MSDSIKKMSDNELACKVQAGSVSSYEELLFRYEKKIFNYIFHKTGHKADAEDLVQITFIRAYRKINYFKPEYPFSSWLYTIARRETYRHFKKKSFHDEIDESIADENCHHENMMQNDFMENLWSLARKKLDDKYFNVLWFTYKEGLPLKETAGIMEISVIHSRVMLFRARNKLLKEYRAQSESLLNNKLENAEFEKCFVEL